MNEADTRGAHQCATDISAILKSACARRRPAAARPKPQGRGHPESCCPSNPDRGRQTEDQVYL
eukprot:127202-Prymnesium_polylepis.4